MEQGHADRGVFLSIQSRTRMIAALAILALTPLPTEEQPRFEDPLPGPRAPEGEPTSRLSGEIALQWTNAYYFRGLRQEDDGLIVQPSAEFAFDLLSRDDFTLALVAGAWGSVHGDADTAGTDSEWLEHWYEQDLYAGIAVATPFGEVGLSYAWYLSPSDAFETAEEVVISYAAPEPFETPLGLYVILGIETEEAADGADSGVYLELGAEPAFPAIETGAGELVFSVPVRVGLSLDDYYEHTEDGDDDTFGHLALGAAATLTLPAERGGWAVRGGFEWMHLGGNAASFNGGDEDELIGFLSLSLSF